MLAILAFTAALPNVHWRSFLLTDEAILAALALLDLWIPSSLVFKAALFARPYIPADECRGDGGSCNVIYTRAKALETDARRGSGG